MLLVLLLISFFTVSFFGSPNDGALFVANGDMPNVAVDTRGIIHIVFGRKDSIFYTYSSNKAGSFSSPTFVTVLPSMYSFSMRGPQIACTQRGLVITACTQAGNIFSLTSTDGQHWSKPVRVNDKDNSSPEGMMSLSSDGDRVVAVWLDTRGNGKNKIYGAFSGNSGTDWMPNKMIYTSPDTTVCECCKPSVLVRDNHVFVMFRNWLNKERNLYLVNSADGGKSFGSAAKLGVGGWKLNGCPMDGGGIDINDEGVIQTVWRREGNIYAARSGEMEQQLGEGKNCTLAIVNNRNIYAWVEKGKIVVSKPGEEKIMLGNGAIPVLKKLDNIHVICVWTVENKIKVAKIEL